MAQTLSEGVIAFMMDPETTRENGKTERAE
jgi:hypothetical protein